MGFRNMKALRPVFFVCFIFLVKTAFAQPFDMILAGDPVLEDLRFLSLESGRPFLSFTPPLAPAEIENYLDSLDPSLLSGPAQEAYLRLRQRLSPQSRLSFTSDVFSVLFDINSTLEGRVRFNRNLDWHPQRPAIPPMLSAPLRISFTGILQLYLEPFLAVIVPHYESAGTFGSNLHYDRDGRLDPTMPHRAFAALGGSWWNFQIGRDLLAWGTGHTGSLSFSDRANYFEYARLSFFSEKIKYSIVINQMPLRIDAMPGISPADGFYQTAQRHFYLHRLDFMFRDTFSIGIMEGRMAGNSPLNLRYLIPLVNTAPSGDLTGSIFSLEANWNIIRSLSVYGQFVMNDFAEPPNSLGFLAGLSVARSFTEWGSVFFFEYIHTYPYLYMNSSPFSSFIHMNRIAVAGGDVRYHSIGFPRDTSALTLGARFFRGTGLSFEGEFTWLSRGEYATRYAAWSWNRDSSTARLGTPEHNFIAAFATQWWPLPFLGFNGSVTGIFSYNNRNEPGSNKTGGQLSFSVNFRY